MLSEGTSELIEIICSKLFFPSKTRERRQKDIEKNLKKI